MARRSKPPVSKRTKTRTVKPAFTTEIGSPALVELVDFRVSYENPGWVVFVSVDDRVVTLRVGELRQVHWQSDTVHIFTDAGPDLVLRHVDRQKFAEHFAAFVQHNHP